MADKLLFRRGTSNATETLDSNEPGFFTDIGVFVVGNGTNAPHRSVMEKAAQAVSNKINIAQVPLSTGNGTTYIATVLPTAITYQRGLEITFESHVANTGAATLNVNGLGAVPILKNGSPLVAGDIQVNTIVRVMHSGSNSFILLTAGSIAFSNTATALPIRDEGSQVIAVPTALNFVGSGVTVTNVSGVATITIPGATSSGVPVQDEGNQIVAAPTALNFVGSGVTVTSASGVATITIAGSTGSGSVPVQEEGSQIIAAPTAINFVGAGATVTSVGGVATVTIPGASVSGAITGNYDFTVNFDANGAPATVTGLPTGWTSAIGGNEVTITHTVGKVLKNVVYFGLNNVGGTSRWRTRYPTAANEVYSVQGQETSKFVLTINSSVVAADLSGSARVSVLF